MTKKIELVLKEVSEKIIPSSGTIEFITEELENFKVKTQKRIDKLGIDV